MTAEKHICAGKVFRGYRYYPCLNTGAHEHEGAMYCKTHHPPTVQAKRQQKLDQYEAKARVRAAIYKAEADTKAEIKRRAECFPELLAALVNLLNDTQHAEHPNCDDGPCPVREARAAIQKATKEQV